MVPFLRSARFAPPLPVWFGVFLLCSAAGCGSSSGSSGSESGAPNSANGATASAVIIKQKEIGPEGGEIVADDGSWKLTVPAMALRFPQQIKVTVDAIPVGSVGSEYLKLTKVYRFEPEGLNFEQPAKFWFKYEQGTMPEDGLMERMIGIHYIYDNSAIERASSVVNTSLNEATSDIPHFSFGIGMTVLIALVNLDIITNSNPVQNIADSVISHFAGLVDDPARLTEYTSNQSMLDTFIAKCESILGYNPLFQAFPGIFPPGTTGGYKVVYYGNGSETGTVPVDAAIHINGSAVTILGNSGNLTRSHYTFVGWNTQADGSGTTYVSGAGFTMGTAQVDLHAVWLEDPKYTVTYNGNGNNGGTLPINSGQYYNGTSVMVASNTGGLYKNSQLFSGWNTQADGNGVTYQPGSAILVSSSNITLYAKWQARFTRLAGAAGVSSQGSSVAADANGNFFVVGHTLGNLAGETLIGSKDGFIMKFNSLGVRQWTRLIGSVGKQTYAMGVVIDSLGNIYIAGGTTGTLDGQTASGFQDVYVMKYDTNGNRQWTRLLGVAGAQTLMLWGSSFHMDNSGNLIVGGHSNGNIGGQTKTGLADAFVAKYDSSGNLSWVRLSGVTATNTNIRGVTGDANGNIYITGQTSGNLDGQIKTGTSDAFLIKYDANGVKQWTRLSGQASATTLVTAVKSDIANRVHLVGYVDGNLDGQTKAGVVDAFLMQYDDAGTKLWTRLLGVAGAGTSGTSIAIDNNNAIYTYGATDGNLDGQIKAGTSDVFLAKYDINGNRKYTRLLGITGAQTAAMQIIADTQGNIFATGFTKGNLDGQTLTGTEDVFVTNNLMDTSMNELFSVTYNGNGNSSGSVPVDSGSYLYGAVVTALDNIGNLLRSNALFLGWNTQANGSGNVRKPGQKFTMGPANTTLYADWQNHWTRSIGVAGGSTAAYGVAVDYADNVLVTGMTDGNLDGHIKTGPSYDGFVTKFDKNGTKLWSQLIGTQGYTYLYGIAAKDTGMVVAGHTSGVLNGQTKLGSYDGVLIFLQADGTISWRRQFGGVGGFTYVTSVTTDSSGNTYASGHTSTGLDSEPTPAQVSGFIVKFSSNGSRLWTRLIGGDTRPTYVQSITTDNHQVYITGYTTGDLDGQTNMGKTNAFVTAYDLSGNKLWTRMPNWPYFAGAALQVTASGAARKNCGGIYFTGSAKSTTYTIATKTFVKHFDYGFVRGYTTDGTEIPFLSSAMMSYAGIPAPGQGVVCDSSGNLSVVASLSTSSTTKPLSYEPALYPKSIATKILFATGSTFSSGIAIDSRGVKYWVGTNQGSVAGVPKVGLADGFVTSILNR